MNRFLRAKPIALVLLLAIVSMLLAACSGSDGPAGATGAAGAAGAAGEAGPQGPAGSAGSSGSAGSAGSAGAPGPPGPAGSGSTAGITVVGSTVYGTGWGSGESVDVDAVSDDGSPTSLGTATANAGGSFNVDASSLSLGGYGIVAVGNQGGKASGVLIVK